MELKTHYFRGEPTAWVLGEHDGYDFQAKVYDEPSGMGINSGRVSKFRLHGDGWYVNYDRGWDVKPENEQQKQIVNEVVGLLEGIDPFDKRTRRGLLKWLGF